MVIVWPLLAGSNKRLNASETNHSRHKSNLQTVILTSITNV
jgi:hypothetical protein